MKVSCLTLKTHFLPHSFPISIQLSKTPSTLVFCYSLCRNFTSLDYAKFQFLCGSFHGPLPLPCTAIMYSYCTSLKEHLPYYVIVVHSLVCIPVDYKFLEESNIPYWPLIPQSLAHYRYSTGLKNWSINKWFNY